MPPRTRTPAPPIAADAESAEPDTPDAPEPASESDTGGWFRNTGPGELTVIAEGPTAVLAPGRIVALERTPTHRDLQPATRADFRAQQAADQASADAQQEQPEDATAPATDTTEA